MTILPLLLSAIALVLAVGAFLKALSAGSAADAIAGLSAQLGSVRESLEPIGRDVAESRASLASLPDALRSQTESLREQNGILASLPDAIAGANGADAVVAEIRSVREATQGVASSVSAGVAALRGGQDSASSASTSSAAALEQSVASLRSEIASSRGDERVATLLEETLEASRARAVKLDAVLASLGSLGSALQAASESLSELRASGIESARYQQRVLGAVEPLSSGLDAVRQELSSIPVRAAEEIAARPAPAPELEELAMAVRDAGALRGDSVRSVADAVSRVAERLEASAEDGRSAREDAASRLEQSLASLESVASGVREALAPLGDALRGHGDAVLPVAQGLGVAQERFEEAAISLRANQAEFAASVGVFTNAAQDLSAGLGAFAREGADDVARDPAAIQQALLESIEKLLGGFSESLRATLVEADLRHREALVELAARLPERAG